MKELLKDLGKHKICVRLTIVGLVILICNMTYIVSHPDKVKTNDQSIKPITATIKSNVETIVIK